MWLASSHSTAYYWSHAGQHFEIRDEGDWCGRDRRAGMKRSNLEVHANERG